MALLNLAWSRVRVAYPWLTWYISRWARMWHSRSTTFGCWPNLGYLGISEKAHYMYPGSWWSTAIYKNRSGHKGRCWAACIQMCPGSTALESFHLHYNRFISSTCTVNLILIEFYWNYCIDINRLLYNLQSIFLSTLTLASRNQCLKMHIY